MKQDAFRYLRNSSATSLCAKKCVKHCLRLLKGSGEPSSYFLFLRTHSLFGEHWIHPIELNERISLCLVDRRRVVESAEGNLLKEFH